MEKLVQRPSLLAIFSFKHGLLRWLERGGAVQRPTTVTAAKEEVALLVYEEVYHWNTTADLLRREKAYSVSLSFLLRVSLSYLVSEGMGPCRRKPPEDLHSR